MNVDDSSTQRLAGKFIVFDGPDGCGKSTQLERFADHLRSQGQQVLCARDPGGTAIGDRIRSVLLEHDLKTMDVRCETFLFMASRAQLVSEVIEPGLADNAVVLCDRFISSTYAYQGAAGYELARLLEMGNMAIDDTWPDLTVVFDVSVEQAFARIDRKRDAMESRPRDFHDRVREVFLTLPTIYPKPVRIVDGGGSPDEVHARVLELMSNVDL